MTLSLKERLVIPNILPTEGNFTTLVIKNDLLDKLKVTQEEIKDLEIKSEGNNIYWDSSKETEKDFDITDLELGLIKDSLNKLDETGKLNDDTFLIFKKLK